MRTPFLCLLALAPALGPARAAPPPDIPARITAPAPDTLTGTQLRHPLLNAPEALRVSRPLPPPPPAAKPGIPVQNPYTGWLALALYIAAGANDDRQNSQHPPPLRPRPAPWPAGS